MFVKPSPDSHRQTAGAPSGAFDHGRGGPNAAPEPAAATEQCARDAIACKDLTTGLEYATLATCTAATTLQGAMRAGFELRAIGRLGLADVVTSGLLRLSASGAADETAVITVWVQLSGSARLEQGRRSIRLGAGDLCLLRSARPTEVMLEDAKLLLVNLPEAEVADRFPLWRPALARTIPYSGGAPAVFLDAVRSLCRWRESLDDLSGESMADAILDLVGAVICFAAPGDGGCVERSLHQRQRVKRFARQHLSNPELSVDLIASGVELSARQIHRLFADEPMSLMRWIWAERLHQCYRELTRDVSGRRSLSDIAYAWGFNDQAHFSRAFRRQFGISPREARRLAAAPGG